MNRKSVLYGLVAAAAIVLAAATYFVRSGSPSGTISGGNGALKVELTANDHTLGDPKAPVTVVEYAAPTCPHCAHWNEDVFPKFKANYIDTGKVHYVFRVFALSPADVAVEAMARCLPKDSYFQFIDMMFRNQSKWDPDGYQIANIHDALVDMGRIAGMGAEKVNSCIGNQSELDKIAAIGQHAEKAYGINGTPSFIVNGQMASDKMVTWQGAEDYLNGLLKTADAKK